MQAIDLILEGFESAILPCSFVLLVPGGAAAIAARQESTSALTGFSASVIALSWYRFSGRGADFSTGVVALLLATATVLLLIPLVRRLNIVSGLGGLLAGAAAATLWVPCVGTHFGQLLTDLPGNGATGFGLHAAYTLGVLAPLLVLGAVMHLVPKTAFIPVRPVMMMIGGTVLGILSLATAAGLIDSVIGQLVEWSVT